MRAKILFLFALILLSKTVGADSLMMFDISDKGIDVTPPSSPVILDVGNTVNLIVLVRNHFDAPKDVTLALGGTEVVYWSWFEGHRYDASRSQVTVTVGAQSYELASVTIMGGKTGPYTLSVASSIAGMNPNTGNADVQVLAISGGVFKSMPDFGWIGFLVIGIVGALVLTR